MTDHNIDNKWDDEDEKVLEKIDKIPVKELKNPNISEDINNNNINNNNISEDIINNNISDVRNTKYDNLENINVMERLEKFRGIPTQNRQIQTNNNYNISDIRNIKYDNLENINVMKHLQKLENIPVQTNKNQIQINKPEQIKIDNQAKDPKNKTIKEPEVKIIEKEKEEPIKIIKNKEIQELGKSIYKLEQTIKILADHLKTFTDAKSWQAISKGNIHIRKYANYYDRSDTITTAGTSNPNDPDSNVYNIEPVFANLERYAEIVNVSNDGKGTLFAIVSHGGTTNLSLEEPIYAGEIKTYYNVYEIRLRSAIAGHAYRVSEYDICCTDESVFTPIEKANLHNQDLPAANADWLASSITPSATPSTFKIMVAVSIAGNFSVVITKTTNGQVATLNATAGPALIADGLYTFEILVHSGDSINFRYSATGGIIRVLRVQEADASTG